MKLISNHFKFLSMRYDHFDYDKTETELGRRWFFYSNFAKHCCMHFCWYILGKYVKKDV